MSDEVKPLDDLMITHQDGKEFVDRASYNADPEIDKKMKSVESKIQDYQTRMNTSYFGTDSHIVHKELHKRVEKVNLTKKLKKN